MSGDQKHVLKCGYMNKQGKVVNLWKQRYFKLCSNYTLEYYHYKSDIQPRGVIHLSFVTNMHKKKAKRFIVETPSRSWKFKLNSSSERDAWFQQIFEVWKHNNDEYNLYCQQQTAADVCNANFIFHKVAVGQTLTGISSKYGISEHRIKQCNKDVLFGTRLHRLSGKLILIPRQKCIILAKTLETNSDQKNNNNLSDLNGECCVLSADHLLKLLDAPNAGNYLYFISRKLRELAKERDESIVDKMLEHVLLKFEVYIQKQCCNIEHVLIHNCGVMAQILKICKIEDEAKEGNKILRYCYTHWMEWMKKQKQNEQVHIREFIAPKCDETVDTMKHKLCSAIRHCIAMKVREIDETQPITQWIKAIDDNMKDMDDIERNVNIQFVSDYNVVYFYMNQYYREIIQKVMDKLNNTKIATHDIICILSWIEHFKVKLKNGNVIDNLSQKQTVLMKLYIDCAQKKWCVWVHKIVENECSNRECFMINDVPRVHCVQDVFTALNHQFDHVMHKYTLNGALFIDIIMLILNALDGFHALLTDYIDSHHNEFEDQYLCGLINSIYDVSSKLSKYQDGINDKRVDEYMILSDAFDERISKFTTLTKQCAMKLAQKVCHDSLQQNVFKIWFSLQYFVDETGTELIDCMILTINEYLQDFNVWIEEDYFVTVFCKSLVKMISDEYIKALIEKEPRTSKLMECIRNDCIVMNAYFGDMKVFTDLQFNRIWQSIYEYLSAIHVSLEIQDELFDAHCELLQKDTEYSECVLRYIVKKRKIQHMDHVLSNTMHLRKLKHNKITKKMALYIQKTKQNKNNKMKQQNKGKKRLFTF